MPADSSLDPAGRTPRVPRGRVMVLLTGIRGPTVVELDALTVRSAGNTNKDGRLFRMELEWPDLVDFQDVVYFLWIEDGYGRYYHVYRLVECAGSRIRLEAGRDY